MRATWVLVKDAAAEVYERLVILRCQAGDEAALGELIERFSPGVRLYLGKIGGQAGADDLLQDTWFEVYRKINRLQNPNAFAAWLYRIARDKAYRELRRGRRVAICVDEALSDELAEEEETFAREEAQAVRAALDQIPVEQREVLVLRFIEAMSYEDIAEVIGRPIGTVRSRIYHGKRALRAKLESKSERKEMTS
jgi:RNA polymerase sigma-70 factor (ECF subfamily)